ncbi:MAG: site-specific integrase [Opitutaceae bacterium]|nr:site-specific integrase [Opitutaceae bacterium]
MKSPASFVISEFTNPSGEVVFRVAGHLDGQRVRKNFSTRVEAHAERQALEISKLQAEAGVRPAATRLSDGQLREAEAGFHRLEGRARSLTFYLDFALANYRDPVRDVSLAEASKEYLALREADHKQGNLSHRQFTSFRCELRAMNVVFRGKTVAELTATALADFFKRGNASKKTYNNRRGLISAFLKYGLLKDWVAENVITKVPYFRGVGHRRGSALTLTAKQCAEIMVWAEENHNGALVPFIALCLFAGIRPDLYEGEISKLEAKDIRLDTGVILVEPHVSKVRMKRSVAIQPNLAAWFRAYPLDEFPIMPCGFRRLRLKFRKQFGLSHDILRHTFISMFVGKFRSMGEAALQAGNSESIIRKHYLDLKSTAEAEQFFGILPKRRAVLKPIPVEAGRPVDAAA